MPDLTPSLEDYLEAIWVESLKAGPVRVKDIGEFLGVKTASVVGALKTLVEKKLVKHERYGYIELTHEGQRLAKEIYEKHKTLIKFLNGVLGTELETAVSDACKMEHHVNPETMRRIEKFVRFVESRNERDLDWLSEFRHAAEQSEPGQSAARMKSGGSLAASEALRLCDLRPGQKAAVKSVVAEPGIKRRFLEMGIVPGAEVKVEKVAPFGDPMDIVVRGYHLSIRREEAAGILVEESTGTLPLSLALSGHKVEIQEIRGGRGAKMRLAKSGVKPGVTIHVVSTLGRGPVVISLDGTRTTVGYGVAQKIMVRPLKDEETDEE
jgi:DtxR family Mn-dependent transcriptional regulator